MSLASNLDPFARREPGEPTEAPPEEPTQPGGSLGELSPEMLARLRAVLQAKPTDDYDAARRLVAPLIERLARELERILRPNSYPRWVRGFPSGSALDLRAAMRFNADPASYLGLWKRKTIPSKRDRQGGLGFDARRAHSGLGRCAKPEVLERLGVPFAVHGFQDRIIRFKEFEQPMDAVMRKKLGSMPFEVVGTRPGGHNNPGDNFDDRAPQCCKPLRRTAW